MCLVNQLQKGLEFQRSDLCPLSPSDFSSPLASAFAAPPQTDRLWCQGPWLRSSGLTGCRRHNPGETDCSLLSLICENPKCGPRALSRSNRSVTGWWEGRCNWRVRSINSKTGRGGALKMQTVALHSRADTCLYCAYTLSLVWLVIKISSSTIHRPTYSQTPLPSPLGETTLSHSTSSFKPGLSGALAFL